MHGAIMKIIFTVVIFCLHYILRHLVNIKFDAYLNVMKAPLRATNIASILIITRVILNKFCVPFFFECDNLSEYFVDV